MFPYAPHSGLWFARLRAGHTPQSLVSHAGVVAGIFLAIAPTSAQEVKPAPVPDPPVTSTPTAPIQIAANSKPEKAHSEEKSEADAERNMPPSKAAVNVAWLLQAWYGNGLGDTLGGGLPGRGTPQGRNYGTGGRDDFRFRRARVSLTGNPLDNLDYRVMFDLAAPNFSQDAWVGYQLGRHARIEIGRQKTGLSEEGSRPDDQLFTIARSVMNEDLPIKGGRVGDARSTGAALRFKFTDVHGFVGVWNSLGDTDGLTFAGSQKFLDGALYVDVAQHVTLGVWGGRSIGGSGPQEDRERAGVTVLYRNGRVFFEGEVAYTRDYAAGAPAPGKNGSLGRGGYLLAAYRLSPQWQFVGRYDNWDPAKQTVFTGVATTESGVQIPKSNHKLHEYTVGLNYTVPHHDARFQLNYIREDTEENGGFFFGSPRSIVMVGMQLGYDSPNVSNARPENYGLRDASHPKSFALQNAIRAGVLGSPRLGLALGADFGLPKAHLLPSAETRISADLLAPFDVPSFLGLPTTQSTVTLDQVFAAHPHSLGFYGGFGLGGYFGAKFRPGGKLFMGYNLTNTLGLELTSHFTGLPDPRYTLQVRFPL
ncbi:MAG: hypothetical protein JWN14_5014 [Chthonomonadales bacterium]|nr:hypothetical protein [Chthonomonadales bacterium]